MNGNLTATRSVAAKTATIMQRAWALVLAAALCLGLMPSAAWAAEGEGTSGSAASQATGTATLTIVKGVDWNGPKALLNKTYKFTEGATVADLFEAAKAAGDIKDCKFADAFGTGSEFLSSVTLSDGSEVSGAAGWWSSSVDGSSDDGSKTAAASALSDGVALQFAWCDNVPNVSPTSDQWAALKAAATPGGEVAGDSGKNEVGSVALAIVKGVDWNGPKALLNKTYKFTEGATVTDLFEAAKAAGDIKDYKFVDKFGTGSEFLSSVTLNDGAEVSGSAGWWFSLVDGSSDDGSKTAAASALSDGVALQFAWCDNVPNVSPTSDQWAALKAAATPGDVTAGGSGPVKPSPSFPKVDAAALDASLNAVYRALFANLASTCAGSGGASENNVSSWKAMEAAAIGQASVVDANAAIAEAQAAYNAPNGFNLQRSIIVLTALGIDATSVPAGQGTLNLVEKVAQDENAVSPYPTSGAFTLLAYASGPYEVGADAVNSARSLIDKLSAAQSAGGGYLVMGAVDVDTTAMVIPALAAYQGDATAKAALEKAVAALRATQKSDGSFGNLNSTSVAIIALCAAGIDPSSDQEWAGGIAPLKALLSEAKSDLSGFSASTGMKEEMVNEQGFRALVAYQGLKNTGAAYNVYTQAKLGQAGLPDDAGSQGQNQDQSQNQGTAGNAPSSDKKPLAKTGDSAAATAAGAAALAACALTASAVAARRARARRVPSLRG